jgi:hypothetical protein
MILENPAPLYTPYATLCEVAYYLGLHTSPAKPWKQLHMVFCGTHRSVWRHK